MVHRAAAPARLKVPVVAPRAVVPVVDLLRRVHLLLVVLVLLVLLVVLVPQVHLVHLVEDTTVEDIDPDNYISMDVTKEGLALMYKSVCFHLEKWPGGHPLEQEGLVQMKDNLLRIMLEQQFRNQK